MLHLWVVGFTSILGQTVLLRELHVAFYGVDLVYLLALGIWLLWSAAGAVADRRGEPSPQTVRVLLAAFALVLALDFAFVRGIRVWFGAVPGAFLPFHLQILTAAVALLPVGFLSGLLFRKAAALYMTGARSLAGAYAVESLGGLAGGLWATLALEFGIQNFAAALTCSLVAAAAACFPPGRRRWVALPACCLLAAALLRSGPLDRAMTSWTHPGMVESRDSPYGRVTIDRAGGQIAVFENDALSFETEGTAVEEFVHLAALQHPRPAHVLVLGGGVAGSVAEILRHRPELVDYVELNPVLMRAVRPFLPPEAARALENERVRTVITDPRRFLDAAGQYDLILAGMPEPTSGQANRYYTAEFFRQCAGRLTAEGVLAFRLPSAENLWTVPLARRNAGIYRALRSAFADAVVLPGAGNIFLASRAALVRDPDVLAARFESRGIRSRIVSRPYIRYLYLNERFGQIARILESAPPQINSDERPVCFQYTAVLWLSKFFPRLAFLDPSALWPAGAGMPRVLWVAALLLPALFLAGRGRAALRRALLAGTAGLMGMVLETLLILHYQVKRGLLYQDIGGLLMSFMAGLALGAYAVDRHASLPVRSLRPLARWGPLLLAGFAALGLAAGWRIRAGSPAGIVETALLLVSAGFLVAGTFAFAGMHGVADQRAAIGPLYGADLIGGCVGCLASALVLIPLAGLTVTAWTTLPLALLSALLLYGRSR